MSRTPVQVELHEGRLELTWPGLGGTGPLRPRALLADGVEHAGDRWRREGQAFTATCGPLTFALEIRTRGARARLRLSVQAGEAIVATELGLIAQPQIAGREPGWLVYSGYQSWDPSGIRVAEPGHSWWTSGLADQSGAGIAASALAARRAVTRFDLLSGGELAITAEEPGGLQDHPPLWHARRGGTWRADPIALSAGPDVRAELRALANQVRGRPAPEVPKGWLSWYHYGPWVSHDDVVENSRAIDSGPLGGLGYDVVQVDDGWQELYGDWVANEKFPGGLKALADALSPRDQVLGVWTAPFLVSANSRLAATAPDHWFIPDPSSGERATDPLHLVFGPMHVLDARHPEVRDHLRDTFRRLRTEGVRYFKIDFLYAGGYAGIKAVRQGVEAIREGIGDDAYLLACGAPLLPMVGLADGCRIGRDTATPIYDFVQGGPKPTLIGDEITEVARNVAARHFLDRWFHLDADVALVGGNLTPDQARACVTFCALSGGPFFASDHLTALPPERLQLLTNRDVLDLVGGPPAVPDWLPTSADKAPVVWRAGHVVAAFNWELEARFVSIPADHRGPARDLWTGESLGDVHDVLEVVVPPQGVRLIAFDGG